MTREEILQIAKPMLFNTDMVRAILDDRKTATRRLVKPRYRDDEFGFHMITNEATGTWYLEKIDEDEMGFDTPRYINPPYQVGDILYVRETWGICNIDYDDRKVYVVYKAGDERKNNRSVILPEDKFQRLYDSYSGSEPDWRPSIHMPKEAARIFLRVTDVRVERLQDITDSDCKKEGIRAWSKDGKLWKYAPADGEGDYPIWEWQDTPRTPQVAMQRVWNSTVSKKDLNKYGWEANPRVWVIEFERCEIV